MIMPPAASTKLRKPETFTSVRKIIQGGNDLRVGPDDTRALSEGAKTAREGFLPDMNHVLKAVLPQEEDNWAAYSDPAYPLATGLAGMIVQFINEKVM